MMVRLIMIPFAALGLALGLAGPLWAQGGPFDLVVRVDEAVVTRFEIDQRRRFLEVLRAPGTGEDEVLAELIDDRIKESAARRFGALATPSEVDLGMEEFATRANLTVEEFLIAIGQAGVAPETFRAFVRSGITWRTLVRQRFSSRARVGDDELDRAVALGEGQGSVQVLLSEIVLPLTPQSARQVRELAADIAELDDVAQFERAAREVSISPTAERGGQLDWLPLSDLPPQVAPLFLTLAPGEVTPPVPLPGADALALFQLRALRDGRPSLSREATLSYMVLRLAPEEQAGSLLGRLSATVRDCDALYGAFPGADETRLQALEADRSELGGSVTAVLDQLDPGELATLPGDAAIVMLCARTPVLGAELSRDDLRRRLFGQKLEDLGDAFLAQLRADAFIERL